MRIDFTKMHGVGNDFAVFEAPAAGGLLAPERVRALADRRTGIGFDQALVLEPARRADSALFYRVFNCDGDEVEQCGNGARCIAALLFRRGRSGPGAITLESPASPVESLPPIRSRPVPVATWVSLGATVLELGVFGVFGALGVGLHDRLASSCGPPLGTCSSSTVDEGRRDFLIADISLGVAGAAFVVTAVTWLVRPTVMKTPRIGLISF